MAEILTKMGAKNIRTQKELTPYSIAPYQSTHCTGGAIMGSDPGNSVTNGYGQVWDTPNAFVTGAALFPQNPGMNPTGTVCALAYRVAGGIINKYQKDPGKIIAEEGIIR
jgi:gluconate 2-dehydrogenase alpha chain